MENKENFPHQKAVPGLLERLPLDTRDTWIKAMHCLEYGQIEEAIAEYSLLMSKVSGSSLALSVVAIHRAEIYIEEKQFEEAGNDLLLAKSQLATLNGKASQ